MNQENFTRDSVSRLFYRYLFPSILGMLVTSIYILADTIVIGKGIGSDALAALNIILPVFNVFFGIGLLFGVGGSVLMSVARGKGDKNAGHAYFTVALILNLIVSVLCTVLLFVYIEPLCYLLGASDVTMPYIEEYAPYVILGLSAFSFSSFLQTFVRNDGAPKLAMAGVVTGGVLNIILDIVFVYPLNMGMRGASIASVIGAGTTALLVSVHFLTKKNGLHLSLRGFSAKGIANICKTGFVSFIIEICSGVLMFLFNIQLLRYVGEVGVSVYGVICNVSIIIICLCNGITQAAQPIISTNYGAGLHNRIHKVKRLGIITAACICTLPTVISLIAPDTFTYIFMNPSEDILALSSSGIRIYSLAYVFLGINLFIVGYFQSTLKPQISLLLCFLRGLILAGLFVLILPLFMGVTGIWIAVPLAELCTLLIAIIFLMKSKREGSK